MENPPPLEAPRSPWSTRWRWVIIGAVAACVLVALWPARSRRPRKAVELRRLDQTPIDPPDDVPLCVPGISPPGALEVTQISQTGFVGHPLWDLGNHRYRRSLRELKVVWPPDTRSALDPRRSVRAGAVVFVDGGFDTACVVSATRIQTVSDRVEIE